MARERTVSPPRSQVAAFGALRRAPVVVTAVGLTLVGAHYAIFSRWLPNARGGLGHDYSYVLPQLLDGYFWYHVNGLFAVPWFTPSFCGGVPSLPDPQSLFYSLPQLLTLALNPLDSVRLTLAVFAAAGFFGFYLLVRRIFLVSTAAALLGAALFLFNGFYAHRMIIGHFPYHAFMLLPLTAMLLLRPATSNDRALAWRGVIDTTAAALLIAYAILSGMVTLLPAFCVTVVIIAAIAGLARADAFDPMRFGACFAAAVVLALCLCAGKLAAAVAYTRHFPRDLYPLPGFPHLWDLVRVIGESLFWAPADALAQRALVNAPWRLDRHEFEFGVTLIPLVLILIAVPAVVRLVTARPRGRDGAAAGTGAGLGSRRALYLAVVALLLLLPVALNYYTPSWNAFLKQMPVLRSSSNLTRWLLVYVPVVILLAALALEHTVWLRRHATLVALAGIVVVIAQNATAERAYYDAQEYDPTEIIDGYARTHAGLWTPAITDMFVAVTSTGEGAMPLDRNDALARGRSQILCYQPIFGYRLEEFPIRTLHPGPALDELQGTLNVKNPACYVFAEENQCAPGDHFRVAERAAAERFLRFEPFPFALSARQRLANWLSLATLVGLSLFGIACVAREARHVAARRRTAGAAPTPSPSAPTRRRRPL